MISFSNFSCKFLRISSTGKLCELASLLNRFLFIYVIIEIQPIILSKYADLFFQLGQPNKSLSIAARLFAFDNIPQLKQCFYYICSFIFCIITCINIFKNKKGLKISILSKKYHNLSQTFDSSGENSEDKVNETTIKDTNNMPIIQAHTPINLPKCVEGYPSPNPTVVIVIIMSHISFARKEKSKLLALGS